ncbi:MAG: PilZ domain-containing protein [Gammaproteobacteria bacterium]|nr:PilZ domain-containing protein [Gammaproteobacteria bacterium]MCB1903857.1 PilZ domain-containing protein [Gammaproteobacteria bacterium]
MQENRVSPRKRVNEKIQVRDLNTDALIGNLVNISAGGLMLLSEIPLTPNRLFQFSLSLPAPIDGATVIEFGAECLWVQDDTETSGPCWAGFQIIDISDLGTKLIEQLINEWTE